MHRFLIVGLFVAATLHLSFRHAFYVSICQIEHNTASSGLEITHQFFIDDLEKGLESLGTGKLKIGTTEELAKANVYLKKYLKKHFNIWVDGHATDWEFIGKETEDDLIWIYLEITDVKTVQHLKVQNSMLTDVYDRQTNMVHVRSGNDQQTLLLSKDKMSGDLVL